MSPEDAIAALRRLPQFVEFSGKNESTPRSDAVLHVLSGQIVTALEVNTVSTGLLGKQRIEPALEVSNITFCADSIGRRGVYLRGDAIAKYVAAMANAL